MLRQSEKGQMKNKKLTLDGSFSNGNNLNTKEQDNLFLFQ